MGIATEGHGHEPAGDILLDRRTVAPTAPYNPACSVGCSDLLRPTCIPVAKG